MSTDKQGTPAWCDLTVTNTETVRDFYAEVIGWKVNPVDMGEYQDYSMQLPKSGRDIAGVCHARGANAGMPAQWMLYFKVADIKASVAAVERHGGKLLTELKGFGGSSQYAVIEDPAGAVCAIYQQE